MAVFPHMDSWVELGDLGKNRPYHPTYSEAMTLGPTHRRLLDAPLKPSSVCIDIGIAGSLRREDAAKLYELAFFGEGDVLVLGLGHGLAAAIVAQAVLDADRTCTIFGVDEEPRVIARVRANLAAYNFTSRIELVPEHPATFCRSRVADGRTCGLVFVDHSTDYHDVRAVTGLFPSLLADGGFALFHDFNDRRNKDAGNGYGMYAGVIDGLPSPPFAFFGAFGCTGLYRKETSPVNTSHHRLVGEVAV